MSRPAFDYRNLPLPARAQLVEDIWDSIAEEANARLKTLPVPEDQRKELARRVSEADARPDDVIEWERVRKELFKRGK